MPKKGDRKKKEKGQQSAQQAEPAQQTEPAQRVEKQRKEEHAQPNAKRDREEQDEPEHTPKKLKKPSLREQVAGLTLQLQALEKMQYNDEGNQPAQRAEEQLTMGGLKHLFNNDRDIDVPTFEASEGTSLQDWLTFVEIAGEGASDAKRIKTVMKRLKDESVRQRIIQAQQVPKTWLAFKQLLLGDHEDLLNNIINEWESVSQEGRSVEQYLTHFQGALRRYQRADPSFQPRQQQQVSKFRKGLQQSLRSAVAVASCATVLDVVKAAKRVEADKSENQRGFSLNSIQDHIAPAQRDFLFRPEADQLALEDEAKRSRLDVITVFQTISQRGGKCYECGELGHWRGDPTCVGRHPQQRGPGRDATPCPRHPDQGHSASACHSKCERHPNADHTKHACSSRTRAPPCFQFRSGHCTYGNRCRFAHEGGQSQDQQQRGRGRGRDRDQDRPRRERSPQRQRRDADIEVTLNGHRGRLEKHPDRAARDSTSRSVFGNRG